MEICPPALIYIVFSFVQIVIDTSKGLYNVAFFKFWVAIIMTVLLNYLCSLGLSVVSWIIVFIPFILMTFIIALLILAFGLNPTTGKVNYQADIYNVLEDSKKDIQSILPDRDEISRLIDNTTTQQPSVVSNIKDTYFDNYNDANVNTIQSS